MAVDPPTHLDLFRRFAADNYPGCTLEVKVGAYLQHHPVRALPLLLELMSELNVTLPEESNVNTNAE